MRTETEVKQKLRQLAWGYDAKPHLYNLYEMRAEQIFRHHRLPLFPPCYDLMRKIWNRVSIRREWHRELERAKGAY